MAEHLDGITIAAAANNPIAMQTMLRSIISRLPAIDDGAGLIRFVDDPTAQPAAGAPPPQVSWIVNGVDGQLEITITLPQNIVPLTVTVLQQRIIQNINTTGTPMVHQIQIATTLNFDAAGSVETFGPFSELTQTIQRPQQTYFLRIRSSFDGTNWNDWQVYSSATACGPVGVKTGYMRSTSTAHRGIVNSTNNATVDSIDNGDGTDTIRIYGSGGVGSSFNIKDGQLVVQTVAGGLITPAAQSKNYQVMWSADLGFQAFRNDTSYAASLFDDQYLITGKLVTVAAGGGGGTTGGGGSDDGGNGGDITPHL